MKQMLMATMAAVIAFVSWKIYKTTSLDPDPTGFIVGWLAFDAALIRIATASIKEKLSDALASRERQ